MSVANDVDDVLHRIRIRLFPANLPRAKGAYYARVSNEAQLSIEDVAAALKNRGGATGNYDEIVKHVRQFMDEAAYQLCDGFAVNLDYFSIHPAVGGLFDSAHEAYSAKDHPLSFRFRSRAPMRSLAKYVSVMTEDGELPENLIDNFTDVSSGAVNNTVTPDGFFRITGLRIKVAGNHPDTGVYFVSRTDSSIRIKVNRYLSVNTDRKITGVVPGLPPGEYTVEIKTQYTIGGIDLIQPRTVTGAFTLKTVH